MLAEEHCVVTTLLLVEDRIAVVRVAEPARAVELPLHLPEIAIVAAVLVPPRLLAEKVIRHVLDRVKAQAIGFGAVHLPSCGTDQVTAHILNKRRAVGLDVALSLEADLLVSGATPEFRAGLVDQHAEVGLVAVFVLVVLVRPLEVAHERIFRVGRSLGHAEVRIGCLVGDVDEVGKPEVLNLPSAVPVAGIVPLAVKAVLGLP